MTNELEIDERFIKSGSIAAKVRDYFKNKDLVGMTVNQVCTEVEDMTRKLGAAKIISKIGRQPLF